MLPLLRCRISHVEEVDFLVAVWFDEEEKAHFWRFPKEELVERGVMSSETEPGKTSIWIYGPVGVGKQPDEKAKRKAETWSVEFYVHD